MTETSTTSGQALTATLRLYFSVGQRSSRYRKSPRGAHFVDLHANASQIDLGGTMSEQYVVTFDPRPAYGPGSVDGLRRMTLADARDLLADALLIPKHGRIVNAATLETIAPGTPEVAGVWINPATPVQFPHGPYAVHICYPVTCRELAVRNQSPASAIATAGAEKRGGNRVHVSLDTCG